MVGGEGGIRTLEGRESLPVFKISRVSTYILVQ